MRDAILILGLVALAGALVTGVLTFLVYPAQERRQGKHGKVKRRPSPRQGLAQAMFIIFAAGAFVALFFGMLMPG